MIQKIKDNKVLSLVVIILLSLIVAWNIYMSLSFRRVIPSSFAMEFCSCYFVEKQNKEHCEWYSSQIIPVSQYHVDEDKKAIKAYGLHEEALATFQNERLGCLLQVRK
ncbi:hypothetical protein MJH12_18205 [bacterium]|nr:hypothetical protein [bacterium]